MGSDVDFPLSVFRAAFHTVVGWTLVVLGTVFLAVFVVNWVGQGEFPGLVAPVEAFFFTIALSIFFPPLLLANAATLLIWRIFLLFEVESLLIRVLALVGVFLIWLATGAWMGFSLPG